MKIKRLEVNGIFNVLTEIDKHGFKLATAKIIAKTYSELKCLVNEQNKVAELCQKNHKVYPMPTDNGAMRFMNTDTKEPADFESIKNYLDENAEYAIEEIEIQSDPLPNSIFEELEKQKVKISAAWLTTLSPIMEKEDAESED